MLSCRPSRANHVGTPTDSSTGEDRLEQLLFDVLVRPERERAQALAATCARFPDLAVTICRRYALLTEQLPEATAATLPTFGRFRLLRRLGGGQSDVFLADDGGRQVVVKLMRHAALLPPAERDGLAREIRVAARVRHPGICPILESGALDGVPFVVQPWHDGTTLADWILRLRQKGRAPATEDVELAIAWTIAILRALTAAHAAGLVHRDVHPGNIWLRFRGGPLLLDFGLATEAPSAHDSTSTAGTLPYMAPEALVPRERALGPTVDLWGVGVTLFEAATGALPFVGSGQQAQVRAILTAQMPDPRRTNPWLPRGLERVLAQALAPTAWQRYATASEFADDLQRVLDRRRPLAPALRPPWHPLRLLRRRPVVAAVALVALVLALVGVSLRPTLAGDRDADLLALATRLERASVGVAELVPGWPHQVDELQQWVQGHGEPLARDLPRLDQRLAALAREREPDRDRLEVLQRAQVLLREFVDDEAGGWQLMRRRLEWAQRVGVVTLERPAAAWAKSAAELATDPRFADVRLVPQLDLVPLGRDPNSGLQEFYHPRSGWAGAPVPTRDPADGRLDPFDGMGIVFVLIPGGSFVMGEQRDDPTQPKFDPEAGPYARPHLVELAPFFLAKFELTRAQWFELSRRERWSLAAGQRIGDEPPIGFQHPVESVTAEDCDRVLAAVGLQLPTESQWEYACGARSTTRWFFGADVADLPRYANVADQRQERLSPGRGGVIDGDDGFTLLAPVGTFAPNAFGLHDMIGNVAEWCQDSWAPYGEPRPRPGDGLRPVPAAGRNRVHRGASFVENVLRRGRTAARQDSSPAFRKEWLGLRAMRPLWPGGGS